MNIGDKLTLVPSVNCPEKTQPGQPRALPCRVVYIHPERRFFTVEFRSEVTGETFRESFGCPDKPNVIREQPQVDGARWFPRKSNKSLPQRGGIYTKGNKL